MNPEPSEYLPIECRVPWPRSRELEGGFTGRDE